MNLMRLNDRIHRVGQVVLLVVCVVVGLAGASAMDDFWTGLLVFLVAVVIGLVAVGSAELGHRLYGRMYGKLFRFMDAHPEEMAKMEKDPVLGRLFRLVRKQD